jgi:hypothetical protein
MMRVRAGAKASRSTAGVRLISYFCEKYTFIGLK